VLGGNVGIASLGWSLVGLGGQSLVRLIATLVLARFILPAEFGAFALAYGIVGFIPMTAYAALRMFLIREQDNGASFYLPVLTTALLCAFIGLGTLIFLGDALERAFFTPGLASLLLAISCVLVFDAFAVVPEAGLLSYQQFKAVALIELWSSIVGAAAIAILIAVLFHGGAWALVSGVVAHSLIRCIATWVRWGQAMPIGAPWRGLSNIASYCGGVAATQLGNYAALQGDTLIIGRLLGTELLGVYGRAYQLMAVPATTFSSVIDRVLYPVFCRSRDHKRFFRRQLVRALSVLALVLMPATCFFVAIAPELISLLLGTGWLTAVVPFQILVIALYFRAAYRIGESALRALGLVYKAAARQWIYTGLVTIGAFVGCTWGIEGAALGVAVAIVLNCLSVLVTVARAINLSLRRLIKAHIAGAATAVLVTVLTWTIIAVSREYFSNDAVIVLLGFMAVAAVAALSRFVFRQWSVAAVLGLTRP
jgi:O-antigen/teichoic acid export membrane protein